MITIAMASWLTWVVTPIAGAAVTKCQVKNLDTGTNFSPDLQDAIDAAAAGDTLQVKGICVGSVTISKDLTLQGKGTKTVPQATLNGVGSTDQVIAVSAAGVNVTLTDLTIRGGRIRGIEPNRAGVTLVLDGTTLVTGNGSVQSVGGGVLLDGGATLVLNDSARVTGNTGGIGGGIANSVSTVILNDSARVNRNTATVNGGGIWSADAILIVNDSARVNGNTAGERGGGIFNLLGPVTLNDSARVNGNTAGIDGGGIFNDRGSITVGSSAQVSGNEPNDCVAC
jgi:predicted outer membrane repeat protein